MTVSLVTGANRGIGRDVCAQLAARGHRVLLGARSAEAAERAAAETGATPVRLDVTSAADVERVAAEIGELDVLVNNAAITYDTWQRASSADLSVVRAAAETNLYGPWRLTQALLPVLRRSRHGRIVNVSSEAASLTNMGGGTPAYTASKVALNALTCMLAAELRADGILVNAVCPGWVATDMGGPGGRPVAEGAAGVVWAATLPDDGPTGGFFRDGRPLPWRKAPLMILVTGSTGNIGSELVDALASSGEPVRALVRKPPASRRDGVEYVTGDLDDPASLAPALDGAAGVFLLPGYRDMPGVLAEARRAGVGRVVQLSGGSAGSGDMTNAVSRYMIITERAVRDSGLPWTILRPTAFMSNAFRWLPQLRAGDTLRLPFANVRAAAVDPRDIAAVAARALLRDGHAGQIYHLTGPESLLPAEQVAVLGEVLGRDLRFEPQPDDEARAEMSAQMPVEYVDAFFDFYVNGSLDESVVRSTVQDVTGGPPRTFRQWAEAHAPAFA